MNFVIPILFPTLSSYYNYPCYTFTNFLISGLLDSIECHGRHFRPDPISHQRWGVPETY